MLLAATDWHSSPSLSATPPHHASATPLTPLLQEFAEYVRAGTDTGHLAADDMCVLASIGCR